jgi:hypothetical protein
MTGITIVATGDSHTRRRRNRMPRQTDKYWMNLWLFFRLAAIVQSCCVLTWVRRPERGTVLGSFVRCVIICMPILYDLTAHKLGMAHTEFVYILYRRNGSKNVLKDEIVGTYQGVSKPTRIGIRSHHTSQGQ